MSRNNRINHHSDDEVRDQVDSFYQKVTEGSIFESSAQDHIYASLGYDQALLNDLPEEIRSGLSCGNPLAHLFLEKEETLLDLGCGMGLDVMMTRLKFPKSGTIYGVDRLTAMILRAERARDRKGLAGIEFRQGNLIDLPFEDASMDKIISNCVINLEPDKRRVYGEIHRVLKPGGMFFISDITLRKPLTEKLKQQEHLYGGWVGGALPLEELLAVIRTAGFTDLIPLIDEVTPEYAQKWGFGLDLTGFIQRGLFIGRKERQQL